MTLTSPSPRALAHLSMLLFAAFIAGSFTTGALAVPYLAPAPLNAVRFILAALLMGAFAFGIARQKFALPKAPWRFGITGFLTAIYFVTMFIALTMTQPVATSAVGSSTTASAASSLTKEKTVPCDVEPHTNRPPMRSALVCAM